MFRLSVVFVLSFLSIFMTSAWAKKMDLKEVHEQALSYVFETKIQESRTQESQEDVTQAYGSLLPDVSLRASYSEIDPISGVPGFDNKASQAAVNFSQPLLRGLREYSALRIAEQQLAKEMITEDVVKREILFQVAQVYYSILIQDKELENTQRQVDYTRERVQDLKKRVEIGRSRKSELLLVEAQLASAQARVKSIERQRASWTTELERLSGLKMSEVELDVPQVKGLTLSQIEDYLEKIKDLPEIQRAQQEIMLSESQIEFEKGYHLPDLSVDGNVYLARTGFRKDSVWDLSVNLVFPIFEGNQVNSRVKQASLQKNQATYQLHNLKRKLAAEVQELYALVDLDLKRIEVTRRAVRLSEQNYKEQKKEYNLGLVNNQEVLLSLNQFIESRQELDRLLLETAYNHTVLLAKVDQL